MDVEQLRRRRDLILRRTQWSCPMLHRMIVEDEDGFTVKSADGKKKLGGPYATKAEAEKRLAQVEHFKAE